MATELAKKSGAVLPMDTEITSTPSWIAASKPASMSASEHPVSPQTL
ncbi:unnamed protein product [Spirodela intermedia]|uniref:Uncharacterized protein n=1 Tax=Spirodela intermedia TaxID=51605 RepID=A0A7I8KMH2_SPIIN|nr:unnamed protein product [Spirodela intermedia]